MGEAGVDAALIVQPINHKFDHSLVTRYVPCFQQDSNLVILSSKNIHIHVNNSWLSLCLASDNGFS